MPNPNHLRLFRIAVILALSASVLAAVIGTIHWPIVGDSPLEHYATFLLDNGFHPYTQIMAIDLPGTLAIEWTARHTLGQGPLAWRFADFLLTAICWLSVIAISKQALAKNRVPNASTPYSPIPDPLSPVLPGFFAGALFALIHFRDGPTHTGQRDLMMTTMLLPAMALLFQALRTTQVPSPTQTLLSRPKAQSAAAERPAAPTPAPNPALLPYPLPPIPFLSPWLLAGLFLGAATTIKPSGIGFAVTFAALALLRLHRTNRPLTLPAFLLLDGFALPVLAAALWLHHHHAFLAFFANLRGMAAYHASLGRPTLAALLIGSFPSVALAVAIPALPLFVLAKPWRTWQGQFLLAGILLGCASYIFQGKGFPYHRYPTEAFLFLLIGILAFSVLPQPAVLSTEAQRSGETPVFSTPTPSKPTPFSPIPYSPIPFFSALATIALGAFFLAPISARIAIHFDGRNQEFNHQLAADLTTLSGSNLTTLQHQVQCFDNTAGCAATLYNTRLIQATGYLYDCYAFQPKPAAYQTRYRADFLAAVTHANPRILVITDQDCFTMNRTFDRLNRWPTFTTWLAQNYTLEKQYIPPHTVGWWRKPSQPFSYRIYLRK